MKLYDEIKDIITNHYGLKTLEDYKEWLAKWRAAGGTATPEEVELLSPDNINCRDFWRVCEDVFGTDPICNAADGGVYTNSMEANRVNLGIASSTGLLEVINNHRFFRTRMLELGTGLGCVKNYVEVMTKFDYTGFDVNPRIPEVLPTTEDGYLPSAYVNGQKNQLNIAFSSNVLQHVTEKQRKAFFADAYAMLTPGGYLLFNIVCVSKFTTPVRYIALYGQFTLIPQVSDIYRELEEELGFSVHVTTNRMGYHYGFVAQKVK